MNAAQNWSYPILRHVLYQHPITVVNLMLDDLSRPVNANMYLSHIPGK